MRFTFVVLEEHAWRTVQLRHDHALSTVDDERAFVRHQGHFAHIDFLLFNFFHHFVLAGRRVTVINDQLHACAHGRAESQTTGLALTHIKCGLGQVVFQELHLDIAIVRNNGESRAEAGLQAFVDALLWRYIFLQKGDVSIALHLQQIGDFEYRVACTKVFTNALAFGKGISRSLSHEFSV